MSRFIFPLIAGLVIAVIFQAGAAFGAGNRDLVNKYHETLEKGCPPVVVKHTVVAGVLGFLPGGGMYFTENYGAAIRDTLLWPLSVLWDPFLAVRSARAQNMQATIRACQISESRKSGREGEREKGR
ncbi:hypothetical protein HY522_10640 [bacterium]|nr:hypothetical protein [bacterium]